MTYLTIPDELDKRLTALAKKVHLSKDTYAAQLLEEILEEQEDYLIALERSERLEKGIDKALSLDEVLMELGLEKKDLC